MRTLCVVCLALFVMSALGQVGTAGSDWSFINRTADSGLSYGPPATMGLGAAVGDYDGDGWLDICLTGSPTAGTQIWRNNGDKTFTNVTSAVLPSDTPNATIAIFADMDGDGDLDLLLTPWHADEGQDTSFHMMINNGGVFSHAAITPELARHASIMGGMSVGDIDYDGDLDVVLGHYNGPGFCLRNEGPGGMADATAHFGAGLGNTRNYWGSVLADFNNDKLIDFHNAIDADPDYHCRNKGGGEFVDSSVAARTTNEGSDMGLAVGDIDNDGDLDIYSTNIGSHCLYVNDGTGVFRDQAEERGVLNNGDVPEIGWGAAFVDMDHDGDEDLVYVGMNATGSLFQNTGGGYFTDVTGGSGLSLIGVSMVPFDYDNDGDMDLLLAGVGANVTLYENASPILDGTHSIEVKLKGTVSNTEGLGSRVSLRAGSLQLIREMMGNYSFRAGTPHIVHFGLGTNSTAERIRVRWPSGIVQDVVGVSADQSLTITEELMADRNGDKTVNMIDLNIALIHFDQDAAGDADGDGDTDMDDVDLILENFGVSQP